jgi:hypothetical protein
VFSVFRIANRGNIEEFRKDFTCPAGSLSRWKWKPVQLVEEIMMTRLMKYVLAVVFSLAVFAFLQAPVADAKSPVTRPFHISGQMTFLDASFTEFPWAILDQGVASELGKFVAISKMKADGSDFGIFYAADGDQLFYRGAGNSEAIFTGGTGRFKDATGSFKYTMSDPEYAPGPEGTMSVTIMYMGQGTLTY